MWTSCPECQISPTVCIKQNGETGKNTWKTDSQIVLPMHHSNGIHTDKVILTSRVPGFQIRTTYLFKAP